jgi:hypothetical protein
LVLVVPVGVIAMQSMRSASDGVGRDDALRTRISMMDGTMNAVPKTAASSSINAKRSKRPGKEQRA